MSSPSMSAFEHYLNQVTEHLECHFAAAVLSPWILLTLFGGAIADRVLAYEVEKTGELESARLLEDGIELPEDIDEYSTSNEQVSDQ